MHPGNAAELLKTGISNGKLVHLRLAGPRAQVLDFQFVLLVLLTHTHAPRIDIIKGQQQPEKKKINGLLLCSDSTLSQIFAKKVLFQIMISKSLLPRQLKLGN